MVSTKGSILEDVVALLHDWPGAEVKTRVRLPTRHDPSVTREVDVLVSCSACGYPLRIAIECKNKSQRTKPEQIDAFCGKLDDLGIQVGIFVSTAEYTRGALRRAKKAGIQVLMLQGLSADRLTAAIEDALESEIYLFAEITQVAFFEDAPPGPPNKPLVELEVPTADAPSKFSVKMVLDKIFTLWTSGTLPDSLGELPFYVRLPADCPLEPGKFPANGAMIIALKITALTLSIAAKARQFTLVEPTTKAVQRLHLDLEIPHSGVINRQVFESEQALRKHFEASGRISFLHKVRVPRLVFGHLYWPPSKDALERVRALKAAGEPVTFAAVEGFDLTRAWTGA